MHNVKDQQLFADMYQCALNTSHWISVLDQVKARMNVASVVVQVLKLGTTDLEWEARDSFSLEHSALHDKWVNNADNPRLCIESHQPLQVIRDDDVFPENCPIFRKFLKRLARAGLGKAIMLDITMPDSTLLTLVAHRHCDDSRPYDADTENFLYALAPHLTQVFTLTAQLSHVMQHQALLENVVDQMTTGMMMLDRNAKVVWGNRIAKELVHDSSGMTLHNQQLRFMNNAVHHSFRNILSQIPRQRSGLERHILVVKEEGQNAIEIMFTPYMKNGMLQYVLMYLKDVEATTFDVKEIQMLFELTPAEAHIAVAIAEGLTLTEYAERKGVSIGTARIQLKSVFSKMSIGRQSDLVRKLWQSVSTESLIIQ